MSLASENDLDKIFHPEHDSDDDTLVLNCHAFNIHFENCNPNPEIKGGEQQAYYENYFIGNFSEKWASEVRVFNSIQYQNLYKGIDLIYEGNEGHLKYSFIVYPNANPNQISMFYEGVENIYLKNGNLHYSTSIGEIREEQLFVYQEINGEKREIACRFYLQENSVGFEFPNGYDSDYSLVIDPTLIFGTFTGSQADNFGYTATYDEQGNFYAGGIARAAGYPTTPGAFQLNFAGGLIIGADFDQGYDADMSISKFNSTGTALLFSTYLGGSVNEQPHSMVVNSLNELLIYARSNSANFPTTPGAYDRTHNGNMDIVVIKFNPTGTALLGSTFVGGSGDDGVNIIMQPRTSASLKFNYADDARGEIIVDAVNNVYVASSTRSANFPATPGAHKTNLSGAQDGCVFKMNSALTTMIWSTYLGGSADDAAYSLVVTPLNEVYVCGGTNSNNFPATSGSWMPTFRGGRADGFIAHINASGSAIINATYAGTSAYDQAYFVQTDGSGNVYIYGQTSGSYPVTQGVYTNPNSGQFITGLTPNLSVVNFSTVFGKGDGNPDISPAAFLVDNCRNIYTSGWGGTVNFSIGSTTGLPVTPDAYKLNTDGSDFHFMVLSANAATLRYATFFGGNNSSEHVDGGTSRFDKNGVIYQAVCAGCGGYNDFPSTPGAWSSANQSQFPSRNCNLGAMKFEMEQIGIEVNVVANPATTGCIPLTINFSSSSTSAVDLLWDFGDGVTSTLSSPSHTYFNTGSFTVTLIGIDSTSCDNVIYTDTSQLVITARDDILSADFTPVIVSNCDSFVVAVTNNSVNATSYFWNFGDGVTSTLSNPSHQYTAAGTYAITFIASNPNSCNQSDTIVRQVQMIPQIEAGILLPDSLGCLPLTVNFTNNSRGGVQYFWNFGDGSFSTLENPVHTYIDTGLFQITLSIIDSASCNIADTAVATVIVTNDRTVAAFFMDTIFSNCDSAVVILHNQSVNAASILWQTSDGGSYTDSFVTHVFTTADLFSITLIAQNNDACNRADTTTKWFYLPPPVLAAFESDSGCVPFIPAFVNQSVNATSYRWQLLNGDISTDETPSASFFTWLPAGIYEVTLTAYNPAACNDSSIATGTFVIFDYPTAYFTTDDTFYFQYHEVNFYNQSASADFYVWDFDDGNTSSIENPVHLYDFGIFEPCLTATNNFGCENVFCKKIEIDFRGVIDVPNAFSPNGDGSNDVLFVRGVGVRELEFRIYNRWGELVFESTDPGIVCNELQSCNVSKGWDGSYKGKQQEMDVYVYTLNAIFENGRPSGLKKGNITLLR